MLASSSSEGKNVLPLTPDLPASIFRPTEAETLLVTYFDALSSILPILLPNDISSIMLKLTLDKYVSTTSGICLKHC